MTDDLFAGHRPTRITRRGAWHVCQTCGATHRAGRRCLHPTTTEGDTMTTDTTTDTLDTPELLAAWQLATVTESRAGVKAAEATLEAAQARLGVAIRNALAGEWTFRGLGSKLGMSTGALQNWCRY